MPFIPAAAAAVATFVGTTATAVGATAAVAAGAGAVAGAAATGAMYGSIIGAATSAVRGDDILQGALRGAAIGGVTGGVFSGIEQAGAAMFGVGRSGVEQMAGMGLTSAGAQLPTTTPPVGSGAIPPDVQGGKGAFTDAAANIGKEPVKKGILSGVSPEVKAGIAMGGFQAAGNVLAADAAADAAQELEARRTREEEDRRKRNQPGILERYRERLKPPERWNRGVGA